MPRLSTATVAIDRSTVSTGLTYPALIAAFERELRRWAPTAGARLVDGQAPWSEVEREVEWVAGAHGLMIIEHIDQGAILSLAGRATRCSLYLVGNPVIAAQIIRIDVRASLYVPFRVCLYDAGPPDGACIAFDRPSSFLATLERPELTELGTLLDQEIDGVVAAIAR